MTGLILFAFLILTYLVGSIPFGLVISKIFNQKDIRQHGSKNIGATNVTRVLGKKYGFLTLVLDAAKGAIMVIIAKNLFPSFNHLEIFLSLVAGIAVIGHIFPIYLKFKGGKGVATTLAVILAINPVMGIVAIAAWVLIFAISRVSAIGSLFSILLVIFFSILGQIPLEQLSLYVLLFALVLFRHQENIIRIKNGQENKI